MAHISDQQITSKGFLKAVNISKELKIHLSVKMGRNLQQNQTV